MKKTMAIILLGTCFLIGASPFWIYGRSRGNALHIPAEEKALATGVQISEQKRQTEEKSGISEESKPADQQLADQEEKKIALTFDDGPHPFYTEQLLDGLQERGVQVTFFVTGEHAALHPDVIRRMQAEGHLIGNHTYSHIQLRKDNREAFREELLETNAVLREITGEDTLFVRPPYGSWDKGFEKELNMFPVLWTVDPLDWCSDNVSCVTGRIVGHVKENDIILMHDYYESTVTAALQVVDALQADGYTFVTVDEILFD